MCETPGQSVSDERGREVGDGWTAATPPVCHPLPDTQQGRTPSTQMLTLLPTLLPAGSHHAADSSREPRGLNCSDRHLVLLICYCWVSYLI